MKEGVIIPYLCYLQPILILFETTYVYISRQCIAVAFYRSHCMCILCSFSSAFYLPLSLHFHIHAHTVIWICFRSVELFLLLFESLTYSISSFERTFYDQSAIAIRAPNLSKIFNWLDPIQHVLYYTRSLTSKHVNTFKIQIYNTASHFFPWIICCTENSCINE